MNAGELPEEGSVASAPTRGFWEEAWGRYRRNPFAMIALTFVLLLAATAVLSPAIVGTRPVVLFYDGGLYFPALRYFNASWEPPVFRTRPFRSYYPRALSESDKSWWAIWPLIYQDPYRPVDRNEWPGHPGNEGTAPPSWNNFFGTNSERQDVFAKMVHGTQIALLVGLVSTGIAAVIGIVIGALGGYFGGWVDMVTSRLTEIFISIPTLILVLALLAVVENTTIWHLMAVIGATSWTSIARLTRAEFLKLKNMDYVSAARALGANDVRLMLRHILPNALAPVLVPIAFGIASAILAEASLAFLGFGPEPPYPSWGGILAEGNSKIQTAWWLVLFPGAAIFLTVLAYNLIGEGIQQATDPKLRQAAH